MAKGDEIKLPLTSRDVNVERVARLRELFPEAFTEGKIDLTKFPQLLGDAVTNAPERYGLSWSGKSEAIKNIQTLTSGTLLPARGESVNFDATENLIIEGDNLETLKLLQGGYHGRVKMIYIDPPYNTGGEFIYPDNYKEGLADYLKFSGQVSGEGVRLTTNAETDGRYHSKWLTMMYPRLFLARNLLREDGVIFVSIDDHEVHNLRAVMNEIFGEENCVANIVWRRTVSGAVSGRGIVVAHDHIFCYSKKPGVQLGRFGVADENDYKNPDKDPRGPYKLQKLERTLEGARPSMTFEIQTPTGPITRTWGVGRDTFEEMLKDNRIGFSKSGIPYYKQFLAEYKGRLPDTWWDSTGGFNQDGSCDLKELFEVKDMFTNPKPVELLDTLLKIASEPDSIILDFFAGSGTTAQAVLELNAQDGGNRKFILVQLPEPTERKDFPTIADITKERVRRVIKKLETEIATKELKERKANEGLLNLGSAGVTPAVSGVAPDTRPTNLTNEDFGATPKSARETRALPPDLGFKVFKLSSSNFKVWDASSAPKDAAGLAEQLKLMAHNVVENRGDEALLYELVLKSNLPLASKITGGKIGAQTFYDVAEGALAICLERKITPETLRGIMERRPKGVICLDIAFAGNDQLKANIVLEMKSHGIEFHTA
jgi:adenine-specific DNA-methyltransferase